MTRILKFPKIHRSCPEDGDSRHPRNIGTYRQTNIASYPRWSHFNAVNLQTYSSVHKT